MKHFFSPGSRLRIDEARVLNAKFTTFNNPLSEAISYSNESLKSEI